MYYLIDLFYRNTLLVEQVLHLYKQSKLNSGYYVPEKIYLILKNKNLL